jgi:hypothetical protein
VVVKWFAAIGWTLTCLSLGYCQWNLFWTGFTGQTKLLLIWHFLLCRSVQERRLQRSAARSRRPEVGDQKSEGRRQQKQRTDDGRQTADDSMPEARGMPEVGGQRSEVRSRSLRTTSDDSRTRRQTTDDSQESKELRARGKE